MSEAIFLLEFICVQSCSGIPLSLYEQKVGTYWMFDPEEEAGGIELLAKIYLLL